MRVWLANSQAKRLMHIAQKVVSRWRNMRLAGAFSTWNALIAEVCNTLLALPDSIQSILVKVFPSRWMINCSV